MDNRERDGRVELAAAFRLAVRCGFHEGVCNHFSLALSDGGQEFLVNPHGRHFGELQARDLLRVDGDGRVLAGDGEVEASALYIHGRMHVARPELRCPALHALRHGTDLDRGRARLEPINQTRCASAAHRLRRRLRRRPLDAAEGDRLAAALGDKQVLFMANYGVITTGRTVAAAFDDLYYLDACQNQVLAMATGRPLKRVPAAEVERTAPSSTSTRSRPICTSPRSSACSRERATAA